MRKPILYRPLAALLCVIVLLAALLTGCGGKDRENAKLREGAAFTVAVTDMPDTLNPTTTSGGLSEEFFLLAYDPLWRLNASGEPVNCLVEDFDLSSDQLTWTIRLRHDVTFSDGVPLTSRDVKYTYELMMRVSDTYAPYFDGVTTIRCPDNYTVVITTAFVKGDMQNNPTPILPRHIWTDHENALDQFENTEMVGTGPFIYTVPEKIDPQEMSWTFQARQNYFGEPANVGQVSFIYYSTATGAARALQASEVDAGLGMTDVQLTTLEEVPGVELIQTVLPKSEVWAIAFNTREGFFSDETMRQAIEYCTDREWILSMSSGRAGMTGSVWASPGTDYFYQVSNKRGYDPETARSIITATGRYADINGNGYLQSKITEDPLRLSLYVSSEDEWAATAATIIVDALDGIGVAVDWNTTDKPIQEVCTPKASWDMCMLTWYGDTNAMMAALPFRSSTSSLTGWSNGNYDQVLSQLQEAMDGTLIQNLAGQLQQIMYNECPYVVIGYRSDIQAIRRDAWTGYEDVLAQSGGLFNIGSADIYMSVTPVETRG